MSIDLSKLYAAAEFFEKLGEMSLDRDEIVEAMARALFVESWSETEYSEGRSHGGNDMMDVAPETSHEARWKARELADKIEQMNGRSLPELYEEAVKAPGKHLSEPSPESFGHYLAMQALGTGVKWFDDHPEFDLKVPRIEFSYKDAPLVN